jgi:hypothetical protein
MKSNNEYSEKSNVYASEEEKALLEIKSLLSKPGKCFCGSDYEYVGLGTYKCRFCSAVFKNEYAIVRDFVDEYGTSYSIYEISKKTNVSKRLIDLFVKDGRFETVKKQPRCRNCKTPIDKGMYCNRCALLKIHNEIHEPKRFVSGVRQNDDMQGEMHYIHKKEGK